jgi:hypothetical protein
MLVEKTGLKLEFYFTEKIIDGKNTTYKNAGILLRQNEKIYFHSAVSRKLTVQKY